MKLFYKFLISSLIISIIPLLLFTVILLNTTGATLKNSINQNYINFLNSTVVKEINDFFTALNKKLLIAKQIEQSSSVNHIQVQKLILDEIQSSKMFDGIFYLDKNYKIITGMTNSEFPSIISINEELIEKSKQTMQVRISSISFNLVGHPYIDMVYPIETDSVAYLYYRVNMEYLVNKIIPYLKTSQKKVYKNIFIIDKTGGFIVIGNNSNISLKQLEKFWDFSTNKVILDNNKINIVLNKGPRWLIVFQEPTSSAYRAVTQIKINSVILIFLTFCLCILSAVLLAKNLTKPIEELISGIELVASGNFDHQVQKVSNDELSKLVDVFNSMIVKLKKLQEDIKKAERLSTIGKMANILGHEIRNPLASISNAIYYIKLQLTPILSEIGVERFSKIFKHMEILESEIKSTTKIINDMLGFSRLRPPVLTMVNINEIIKKIIEEIKIPEKIKLQLTLTEIPQIYLDIEEIKQVIRNLINNAVDSMENKEYGILKITTSQTRMLDSNISCICLEISDTGCGIPAEIMNKIFEPFFSTKSKGTGLGLAVVKRIIEERHNGKIEIKTVVGEGTSFYIKLPLSEPTKLDS